MTAVASLPTAPTTADEFADWVRPSVPAMLRLAARLAPGADRDDVVQEALVRAWSKRGQYDARRGTPTAWLLAITADRARQARRRRGTTPILGDLIARSRPAEEGLDLEQALERLSGRQRLAVDCFYFAGLTVSETASVMRCSEGTVKSTLSDARGRLRSMLEVK